MDDKKPDAGAVDPNIQAYKRVLVSVLEQRPSGTRQRLADALGKHRSFVSQITSPSYATPIPQRHLATIFSVCHFSPAERETFLAAYHEAHGGRLNIGDGERRTRHLTLMVPDLGNNKQNAALDKAIGDFIHKLTALMKKPGGGE